MIIKIFHKQRKEKHTNQGNNCIQKFNNVAKGIHWFYNTITEKSEDPADILEWRLYFTKMVDNAVTKLNQISIDKNIINQEMDIAPDFC